jgi:hypothetical protein
LQNAFGACLTSRVQERLEKSFAQRAWKDIGEAAVVPPPAAYPSQSIIRLRRGAQWDMTWYNRKAEELENMVSFACKTLLARA